MDFVNYSRFKIQLANPTLEYGIIATVLAALVLLSARRIESRSYLDLETSQSLKGLAALSLIFGHLSNKCLEEKTFFDLGGYWAVVVFLFLSGYGLAKTYGLQRVDRSYWPRRIVKVFPALWLTIVLFTLMDHFLLGLEHSWLELLGNVAGVGFNGIYVRVNSPTWFITYILVNYVIFYCISFLKLSIRVKIGIFFLMTFLVSSLVRIPALKENFRLWIPYTMVFPLGICAHVFNDNIEQMLRWLDGRKWLFLTLIVICLVICSNAFEVIKTNFNKLIAAPFFGFLIVCFAHLARNFKWKSGFLDFLGKYSYEIYLLHMPLMVKYDFFLFRKPFYVFFFVYLAYIVVLSLALSFLAARIGGLLQQIPLLRTRSDPVSASASITPQGLSR